MTESQCFSWSVRVYYEDTDAGGVVYHSRYLNFLERARTEWLRHLGLGQDALARELGIRFAVAKMAVDFVAPAMLDDLLTVTVTLSTLGGASLLLDQGIWRNRGDVPLIRAQVRIACVDLRLRPTRLPGDLRQLLRGVGGDLSPSR